MKHFTTERAGLSIMLNRCLEWDKFLLRIHLPTAGCLLAYNTFKQWRCDCDAVWTAGSGIIGDVIVTSAICQW